MLYCYFNNKKGSTPDTITFVTSYVQNQTLMANLQFYNELKHSLPANVQLVAVSKTHSPEAILELYRLGHRAFGENKVQEMVAKKEHLPTDIQWHLIGHLQSNKVKQIVRFVHLIHGVDSTRLAREIDKEAAKCERIVKILLQVHIAREETKFGFTRGELLSVLPELFSLKNIEIAGLMGMASFTEDTMQVRAEFRQLRALFDEIRTMNSTDVPYFKHLSMGMSSDYHIAIEEGATIIRVGSLIFGEREYNKAG